MQDHMNELTLRWLEEVKRLRLADPLYPDGLVLELDSSALFGGTVLYLLLRKR